MGGVTRAEELGAERGIDVARVEQRVEHAELMYQDHKLQYQHQEEDEAEENGRGGIGGGVAGGAGGVTGAQGAVSERGVDATRPSPAVQGRGEGSVTWAGGPGAKQEALPS